MLYMYAILSVFIFSFFVIVFAIDTQMLHVLFRMSNKVTVCWSISAHRWSDDKRYQVYLLVTFRDLHPRRSAIYFVIVWLILIQYYYYCGLVTSQPISVRRVLVIS